MQSPSHELLHILNMNRVPFIQEVLGVYTSLEADELKMALQARKVSGAIQKQAPSL